MENSVAERVRDTNEESFGFHLLQTKKSYLQ